MLAWTIYISYLGALTVLLLPKTKAGIVRFVSLLTAVAGFGLSLAAFLASKTGDLTQITETPWIPSFGVEYHLAADGISFCLVLLTGVVAVTGILFSWNIQKRTNEFFAFYLLLVGSVYGVFLSYDLLLLFVFYEMVIVPKYFLISIWGSTRREYGAMKLALYSFGGSAFVLVGIIAAYVAAGSHSMSMTTMAAYPFSVHFQMWAFPTVFLGFAVLAGLWPFHSWAPTGHVAAPTAASMLLAGVVMKLGAYGCFRVAMTLFPLGLTPWGFHILGVGSWRGVFAVLAVTSIVYGATVALAQRDLKFVIGYSSVSHMGFILLGLMTLDQIGLSGAVIQMVSHGLLAGLLFGVVGRMLYDRTHTRDLSQLGPMNLNKVIPFAATTFVIAGMASMGMPGFSGFIAELMILLGAWHAYPVAAIWAGFGIVITVAYIWRAIQKAFFAEVNESSDTPALPPISLPEKLGASILIICSVVIGIYPQLLLQRISPALNAPLFRSLHHAGWQ
jgi:NADH-quinone oxidoreductase subunit M